MTAQIIQLFPDSDPRVNTKTRPVSRQTDTDRVVATIHKQIRTTLQKHGYKIDTKRYNESYKIITDELLYQMKGNRDED